MSNSIAPLPGGIGVNSVAEHHPRRDPESRHDREDGERREHESREGEPKIGGAAHDSPAPPSEAEPVPAETLFATTLIADALAYGPPSRQELKLRSEGGWHPPESVLHLKDKLI